MKKASGFTLVEVMIVMVIVTTLVGFVGPFMIDAINKNERKAELSSLTNLLKKAGYRAYLRQSQHTIELEKNGLVITEESQSVPWKTAHFKHLNFPKQRLEINENGFIFPAFLSVRYENKEVELPLDEKVNGITEVAL